MEIQKAFDQGERSSGALIAAGKRFFAEDAALRLDYLEIVDPDTLNPVDHISRSALIAVAAFFGKTRLIDNIILGSP